VTALNKVDKLVTGDGSPDGLPAAFAELEPSLAEHRPDAVLVSAERRWGFEELLARISEELARTDAARPPVVSRREAWAAEPRT
jgi:50S ribosomal subunit-associated GTPase HflX